MSDFQIEDIVELLDNPKVVIVAQVLDIVVSSEACLTDSRVIDRLIKLLSNIALVKRSIAVLTHVAAEHNATISASQAKLIFQRTFPLCFMASQASNTNAVLALTSNLTLSEDNASIFLDTPELCSPIEVGAAEGAKKSVPSLLDQAVIRFVDYNPQIESVSQFAPKGVSGIADGREGAEALSAAAVAHFDTVDQWQHVGSVLCNLCRTAAGRAVVLKRSSKFIPRLVQQIRSLNPTRRRGAVNTLRSCLFDSSVHWWLVEEENVLRYLLYPLVVGTPIKNKERVGMDSLLWMRSDMLVGAAAALNSSAAADVPDSSSALVPSASADDSSAPASAASPDAADVPPVVAVSKEEALQLAPPESNMDIAALILECVLLLCQRRVIRESLRRRQVYVICRNFDVESGVDRVSEIMFEVVNFLMRDEGNEEENAGLLEDGSAGAAGMPVDSTSTVGDIAVSEMKMIDNGRGKEI